MTKNSLSFDNDFEDSFEKSLKSLGYLLPTTENDIKHFEENNNLQDLPQNYSSAADLLKEKKVLLIQKNNCLDINDSVENLARAARNGGNIPDDVLKKMKLDRNKAENDEKQI